LPVSRPVAAVIGVGGLVLAEDEIALLRAYPPAGAILFGRNVRDPAQLAALTGQLRALLPAGAVLLVDQEGGRVARLRPPHWRAHPPAADIGLVFTADAAAGRRLAWLTGALIGLDCFAMGFDVVCAPVLDLRLAGAHDVIGDRAFGNAPEAVAELGRAMAEGLLAAGVQPVGKHAPGHGRARADSHLSLPVVETAALADDLAPFAQNADLPWMMTSHLLYRAIDPDHPASQSERVIGGLIREGIGFAGVLASDDLAMGALSGPPEARVRAALAAGCDLALYCAGDAAGTEAVLEGCPPLTDAALTRLAAARDLARDRRLALDGAQLDAERSVLMEGKARALPSTRQRP
jgi:beta-N-acetylhexosaminidase